jgi:hypothetical protein
MLSLYPLNTQQTQTGQELFTPSPYPTYTGLLQSVVNPVLLNAPIQQARQPSDVIMTEPSYPEDLRTTPVSSS